MKNTSFTKGLCCLYAIIFLCTATQTHATRHKAIVLTRQQATTGKVLYDKMPLSGVTIAVKNKLITAVTDSNGQFIIAAAVGDTLIISYIGFRTVEIPITGNTLTINLEEDTTALREVTVNAGYYTVRESERTGSIAKVTTKEIEKQPVTNPLAAISGRMAGVSITQATGTPGGGFDIKIRGVNSLRPEGNAPLYVVDGVPYSGQSLGYASASFSILSATASPISGLNPSDIESIEVLRDADATAIYGSRGANGVVLITTKRGKAGKTCFSLGSYTSYGKVANTVDLMDTGQYLAMRRQAYANDDYTEIPDYAYDLTKWDQNRYTDWQKELIGGTAETRHTDLALSGGSEATQFLLGGTMHNETTVFPDNGKFRRAAMHANITHTSTDKRFSIAFSGNYTADSNRLPGADLTFRALTLPPNAPGLYDASGNLNWEDGTWNNPLASLESVYKSRTNNLVANTLVSYKLLSGLTARASLGYTDNRIDETRTSPSTQFSPYFNFGPDRSVLFTSTGAGRSWIIEPQLDYTVDWAGGKFSILAGATFQQQQTDILSQTGTNFPSNALIYSLAAAARVSVQSDQQSEYRYQAFFGRINYNLKKKYILNLTGRRDGSSRFGPENRFANFGAIGAAWLFSNESFLQRAIPAMSFGKLRASYGITGNDQIGDYQFLDTYSTTGVNYNGVITLQPTRLFNPGFGWETNKKLEAAIEAGFFNDRIFLTAAWFKNRSSNQLVGVPLAGTTGFTSIQANLGATVENKGTEFELRTVNIKGKSFSWETTANLTIPKNRLVSFPGLEQSSYANTWVVGQPVTIQMGYQYTGIDPATGTYQYLDYNNDGQITMPDDRKYFDDLAPKYYGGITNKLAYKSLSLDFLFQFVSQKGRNYRADASWAGDMVNQHVGMSTAWPIPGAGTQIYTTGDNAAALDAWSKYGYSSAAISDASFVRLKSAALTYGLPEIYGCTAKVYLQGQNLLTFTKYKGADPENQSSFFIAPLRQITIGAQISF